MAVVLILFTALMVPVYRQVCCVIFDGTATMVKMKSFVVKYIEIIICPFSYHTPYQPEVEG